VRVNNRIIVLYCTDWREIKLAVIPNITKHRKRVNALLDALNERYAGYGYFTTREVYG